MTAVPAGPSIAPLASTLEAPNNTLVTCCSFMAAAAPDKGEYCEIIEKKIRTEYHLDS